MAKLGQIVTYQLSANDAQTINQNRTDYPMREGNVVAAGEKYPMMITRLLDEEGTTVNGQVFLDGDDVMWASNIQESDGDSGYVV